MKTMDIYELARSRASLSGELAVTECPELCELLQADNAGRSIAYAACGMDGRNDLPAVQLHVQARLMTRCVACNEPLEVVIDRTVPFLLVRDEQTADSMPIEEDDGFEVVVGSRKFVIADWIQEELILSLPPFARHTQCPCAAAETVPVEPAQEAAQGHSERPNPFASLAQLKTKH